MTATEHVILVDENDNPIGTAEKLEAHRQNWCHRAFSIFIVRKNLSLKDDGIEILLQQRAKHKYHTPLLWTNTCCSHPRPGEDIINAGQRRLKEEMGIDATLQSVGKFHYIAHLNNGLVENELDHVLLGFFKGDVISPNPEEVETHRWISLSDLKDELDMHPERFTPWLDKALKIMENRILVN